MVAFALSAMPDTAFATAALPLFADDIIEELEWSFDMGWGPSGIPDWLTQLLDDYADDNRLLGHGVSFSLLAGDWTEHHTGWLERLVAEIDRRRYRHISEHIGFVGAGRFSFAAPLPVPYCAEVVELGVARLEMINNVAQCPVGLENLATSLGLADAQQQGDLLDDLLAPTDGFVVLDVHNLWAQCVNLGLDPQEVADTYPLHRVREMHVSGGSWDQRGTRSIRRDTHDHTVPTEVLELLDALAPACDSLETVVYERLGSSLVDPATHTPFRDDAREVQRLVSSW